MPPVAWTWKSFFDRIKDVDPDLRSMALFDLQTELEKPDFQLGNDADLCTAKIISCFSKEENNSEVHSQALKLVPVLISKQGPTQRKALLDHLCLTAYQKPSDVPVDKVRAMRDNATGALKGAIPALVGPRADSATTVAQGLLPGLKSDDVKVRTEIFTVLSELLKTLGASVEAQHQAIVDAAIAAVGESNEMLRKKATICLAAATSVCNTAEFEKTMEFTVGGLRNNQGEKQRRHVQLVSAISRAAGGRFSTWVSRVMPLLFAQLKRLDEITDSDVKESPESDDTREHILQALDNIIARCPLYVTESLPEVIKYAASLVSWDPNFCESSDADNDDEGDDEDLLDGDDNSWKVRKSAVKCLLQIVKARPDTLKAVVMALLAPAENGSPLLISRFNERVENVRLDVLDLFRGVISACRVNASPSSSTSAASSGSSTGLGSFVVRGEETLRQEAQLLHPLRDEIIKNLLRSAKHKSVKVKLAVHVLLKDLYIVMGRELGASVRGCAALVAAHLKDPKLALPQLRPDVLDFARVLVQVSHRLATATEDESLIESILTLLDPAVKCTEEKYYRTVVAALKLLNEFVAVVAVAPNSNEVAQKIFDPLFTRLSATDADQEVRRAAMEALALLLREAEKPLVAARAADVQKSFDLIVALLKGETTRVSAARSVGLIQRCALQPAHLTAIVTELTSFLRKLDRQVREQGLRTLASFVTVHNAKIDAASLASIIAELTNDNSKLLSEMELFLTVLALQLGKAIAAIPTATKVATERLVPAILNLLRSPLTQGQSVSESAEVLALLARDGSVSASLFAQAVGVLGQVTDEAAVHNLSAAVGVLCSSEQDTKKRAKNVDDLVKMSTSATKAVAVGGITSLGEAGRWMSLVAAGAASALEKALQSSIEEVKTAASAALGRAASREQGADLLEKLVQSIATETPELLLRLRSLRDCFVAMAADNAASAALARLNAPLFDALVKHAASSNESVAEATSECLGRLAQASPGVVALVAGKLSSVDDKPRATILGAMRFTMPHHASPQLDEAVRQHLPTLLSFLDKAQTPATRRAALQLLTAAAYNRPAFINTAALRDVAFTRLLEATVVDVSLITTVDLGPFKHTTDHGADLRKQAFECLSVFADSLSRPGGILELTEKFDAVVATLTASLTAPETDFDIWASARSTIVKVARHGAGAAAILANASPLANNLKAMVGQKLKEGQDKERVDDANKGAAICAYRLVNAIPALMQNAEVQALLKAADAAPFSAAAKQAAAEE